MVKEINCTDANDQATRLAAEIAKKLTQIINKKGKANIAVSGGKSPIAFFEKLSLIAINWSKVTITLVDERVIETTHKDSNANLVREYLINNKAKQATFAPMISDSYSEKTTINESLKLANQQFIQPDIIMLGMGEDYHTASLFPDVTDFSERQSVIFVKPKTAPYQRLSLSLNTILASSAIYLSIGGTNKMTVYEDAKQKQDDKKPISLVLSQSQIVVNVFYFN